jgi:beta-N-acetylhexosaminidase
MTYSPLILDVAGFELTAEENEILRHPMVGGVILFTRNFATTGQLAALTAAIHAVRDPPLLVAVDHEGGRVQRFREGFTVLPPAAAYGRRYDEDAADGCRLAEAGGYLMARELRAIGVDLSFAPVLDLGREVSSVIGDRAFHRDPEAVCALAGAFADGMRRAGMAATAKHFPGHGAIEADSHVAIPVDERPLDRIEAEDMIPFARLANRFAAVMPAHVIFPHVDKRPAGFSPIWLQDMLRAKLGFRGVIFSDDLSMEGASVAGDIAQRAEAALEAGCDMILVCNNPGGAVKVLDTVRQRENRASETRIAALRGPPTSQLALDAEPAWREARAALRALA